MQRLSLQPSKLSESLRGKLKASRALKRATLYHVLWDDYLTVRPTVRYRELRLTDCPWDKKPPYW